MFVDLRQRGKGKGRERERQTDRNIDQLSPLSAPTGD